MTSRRGAIHITPSLSSIGITIEDAILYQKFISKHGRPLNENNIFEHQEDNSQSITGGMKCKFCNSTHIIFDVKQIRSADEGSSIFYACQDCRRNWKEL